MVCLLFCSCFGAGNRSKQRWTLKKLKRLAGPELPLLQWAPFLAGGCAAGPQEAPHGAVGAEPGSAPSPLLPCEHGATLQPLTGSFASSWEGYQEAGQGSFFWRSSSWNLGLKKFHLKQWLRMGLKWDKQWVVSSFRSNSCPRGSAIRLFCCILGQSLC